MEPEGSLPCSQQPATSLSQMNPVYTFPFHFPKVNSYIFFPSTPVPSEWSLPLEYQLLKKGW